VVLVAIPFKDYKTLPADQLSGKVVVDVMNYYPQRDGQIDFGDLASSELLALHLPRTRLVKAFNVMHYETLATEGRPAETHDEEGLVLFSAGDDDEAKAVISRLTEEIGFEPVDTASLRDGSLRQQPGSPIYNNPMTAEHAREVLSDLR
jgi:8-hydroxy-5-deazaflavin:NADPH oxidoreductase